MSVITYNFEPDLVIDPETKMPSFMYRPYLLVKLRNKKRVSSNFIKALVDSGSDYNVFPSSFATEIGIDYRKGVKHRTSSGIGPTSIYTYGNIVSIEADTKIFDVVIFFADEVTIPILGRHGFFNFFKDIKFNVKKKSFSINFLA